MFGNAMRPGIGNHCRSASIERTVRRYFLFFTLALVQPGTAPATADERIAPRTDRPHLAQTDTWRPSANPSDPFSPAKARSDYGPPELAVLYEDDPTRMTTGGRYVGSVTWRTEAINREAQHTDIAVRGEINIPAQNFKMTMLIFPNVSSLANYTIELSFILSSTASGGGTDDALGVGMQASEQGRGVPLKGSMIQVADGLFRYNLSSVDADRQRNLQLVKEAPWFYIPLMYHNLHRAIIVFEKGKSGYQAFGAAFGKER